jgi:glycosyltransferase involved in cell wall biosynthesis
MIVKNEGHCLAQCLESLAPIANQMIIGDTGSTDDTRSIADHYGATVLSVPWNDDFAEARNAVLNAAKSDWLLHMDADEALDPKGAARIRALVDADGFMADAIELTLANYCNSVRSWRWTSCSPNDPHAKGHAGYLAVKLPRLFRNGCGFEYREPVHENISDSIHERAAIVRTESILIHHYGYEPTGEKGKAKSELYYAIALRKTADQPGEAKAWYDLAELAAILDRPEEAENAARKAHTLAPDHVDPAMCLAKLLLNRNALEEAREILEAIENQPDAPALVSTALGAIACREGRLEEARNRLEVVLQHDPKQLMTLGYLARTMDRLGEPDKAKAYLETAAAAAPSLTEFKNRLKAHRLRHEGEQHFSKGDSKAALAALVQALRLDGNDPYIHNSIGVVSASLAMADRARQSFHDALKLAPTLAEAKDNLDAMIANANETAITTVAD